MFVCLFVFLNVRSGKIRLRACKTKCGSSDISLIYTISLFTIVEFLFFLSKLSSFNLMSSVFRSSFVSVCVFYIRTFVSIKMVCVELLCVNVCTCVRDDDYLQIVFTAIVRLNSCKNFVSLLPNLLPMHTLAQFLVVFSVQIHMCTQTVITKWKNANKFNNNITHLNRSKQKPIGSVCLVSGEI